jgi:nucleotide-binding universal stress UspA family protein
MKFTKLRISKLKNSKVFKNVKVIDAIEIGNVPSKIYESAKKYKADMIVMGTHGVSGFQESLLGSNAERVIRNAEIPVLSVRDKIKSSKISIIVFATDFSKETELVLPAVSKISAMFNAKLMLMKIVTMVDFESTHETEKQIEKFWKHNKIYKCPTQIYYAYSKDEGIRDFAANAKADMIALGTHGRHGLSHLFKGSIAEEVVNHASLPVLTFNFHKKLLKESAKGKKRKPSIKNNPSWVY